MLWCNAVPSHGVFVMLPQVLKKIAKYIQEQNEKVFAPLGLLLTDPIERGLRVVSFSHRASGVTTAFQHSRSSMASALCSILPFYVVVLPQLMHLAQAGSNGQSVNKNKTK